MAKRRRKVWPWVLGILGTGVAWEVGWWFRRVNRRGHVYRCALRRARELGRPLVVVGAPDSGATVGPGCGDITIDLAPTSCPVALRADISKPLPFANDSVVLFVSCVLEYVADLPGALAELRRIAGRELYIVRVEPWTLAAYLYPGTRRRVPAALVRCCEPR